MTQLSPVIEAVLAHHEPHPEHVWLLKSAHVAEGYGCSPDSLRQAKKKHSDELLEGTHWIKQGQQTIWTQRGVIRLGNFIKSERAAEFRTAAENFLCAAINGELEPLASSASTLAISPERRALISQAMQLAAEAQAAQQHQAERDFAVQEYQVSLGKQQLQPLAELSQWVASLNGFQLTTEAIEAISNLSADTGAAVCDESAI